MDSSERDERVLKTRHRGEHEKQGRVRDRMSRVRQKGTVAELVVRGMMTEQGVEAELNVKDLPGSPDLVVRDAKLAIFVHGCFWHRHRGCAAASTPKTNVAFWREKFRANVARDRAKANALRRLGFSVATIWECQTKSELARRSLRRKLLKLCGACGVRVGQAKGSR